MSCLACSLPRLVGLLGLFNSPYPSRTPKLSQWSDRPRRVGLGPQFLSRGSLTVRGQCRYWPALGIYSVWLPVQHVVCPLGRHLLTDCSGGHCWGCRSVMSCLVSAWLACLACSIRPTHPAPPSSVSGLTDRGGPQFLSRGSLTVRGQCRYWPALGIYSVWLPVQHVVCPLGRHSADRLQGRPLHATYPHHGRSILATAASCSVAPNGILPATSNTLC